MTDEDRLLLVDLKTNTQHLFDNFKHLEQKNELLRETILNLKNEIEILKQEKSDLVRKNEQLKIASELIPGNSDKGEAKQKIDFLVREIDKCIALLNR